MDHGKNLKPKPKQHSTCLEIVCKNSEALDKEQSFHDQMKFKAILKLKCDQPEWKISIKLEMIEIIPAKIMGKQNIQHDHHTKN